MRHADLTIATQGQALTSLPLEWRLPTRCATALVLTVAVLVLFAMPVWAQDADGPSLGGGSDLDAGQIVALPAGGALPPLHHLFVENPEDHPVEVAFTADTPEGIQVTGAWEQRTLAAGETARNAFVVEVSESVAAGDHEVYVQIARADIRSEPGQLTGIPAVGARFTVRVVGESAEVTVRAMSEATGQPVDGTLSLAAISADDSSFEVQRSTGSQLQALVAPGRYRATFLLGDRVMAEEEVRLVDGDSKDIQLDVQTVAFTLTDVRPIYDQARLVVVDLTAAVHNEIGEIADAVLQVSVHRGDAVETVDLQRFPVLPEGVSEASVTYRPERGWSAGQHRFTFELVTPDFTLTATDQPELMVADTRPGWMPAAIAATAALLLIGSIVLFVRRRRRPEPTSRPSDPSASTRRRRSRPPAPPMPGAGSVPSSVGEPSPLAEPTTEPPPEPEADEPQPMSEPAHAATGIDLANFTAKASDRRSTRRRSRN